MTISPNKWELDVQGYLNTCNITTATPRKQIRDFSAGVNDLGLWNSMVCWPLRSTQNAATGNTMFSLGGLGTFNGTMTNTPTRGADGMIFDATNKSVQIADEVSLRNTRTVFAAFRPNNNAYNQVLLSYATVLGDGIYASILFDGQNFGGTTQGFKLQLTRSGVQNINQNGSRTIGLGTFRTGGYTATDSTDNVFINGALESGGARTGLSALNATGAPTTRQLFGASSDMVGAFVFVSTTTLTNQQFADLTTTYKTTLGQGLGLP